MGKYGKKYGNTWHPTRTPTPKSGRIGPFLTLLCTILLGLRVNTRSYDIGLTYSWVSVKHITLFSLAGYSTPLFVLNAVT